MFLEFEKCSDSTRGGFRDFTHMHNHRIIFLGILFHFHTCQM